MRLLRKMYIHMLSIGPLNFSTGSETLPSRLFCGHTITLAAISVNVHAFSIKCFLFQTPNTNVLLIIRYTSLNKRNLINILLKSSRPLRAWNRATGTSEIAFLAIYFNIPLSDLSDFQFQFSNTISTITLTLPVQ